MHDRLKRIEKIEGDIKTEDRSVNSISNLYEAQSKAGKRIILTNLFTMSISKGAVIFKPCHKKSKLPVSVIIDS